MPKKVDKNQVEIVAALRKMGASVQHLHAVGKGCPDILAGIKNQNILIEIKDGKKPLSKQKLTPDQIKWHQEWRGQVSIVKSVDDAIFLCMSVKHWK
ncbi:MAG TPA: hypothetical protein VI522_02245 [Gammaproteobacteria bacterium]|nr:hypothetical protein [Gammaproteobacteria bacterium]